MARTKVYLQYVHKIAIEGSLSKTHKNIFSFVVMFYFTMMYQNT